jgi:PAS domain-containing protein
MTMAIGLPAPNPESAGNGERRLHKAVLRLVKGGPERRAIEAGQADAILDPESGQAFLLPGAQRWLLERTAQQRTPEYRPGPAQQAALLDGLAAEFCALDAAGVVVATNRAWRDCARDGLGAGIAQGSSYLAACDHDPARVDGAALAAGIRQVLAGERRAFRYEHACGAPAADRWFQFNVTTIGDDGGARAIVLREDVTVRRRHERLLSLEYAVARTLAEATDAGGALRGVIRAVCEALDWECGRYFRLDPVAAVLRSAESWGVSSPLVAQFLERSRGVVLRTDAGLKGRVFRSGQPLWVPAGTTGTDISAAALAPERDSDGAFMFPVTADARTLGVLAFSGRTIREPDDRMLQAARAIGEQLGRFLVRQQGLDAVRHDEARFRRLTTLSTDWYWQQDRTFRFTEYTGTGVLTADAVLGKTLWELPNVVAASADWDTHREQLGERWSFCDFEFTALGLDGHPRHFCISGEPTFDAAGAFTGYWGTGLDITRRKSAELALLEHAAPLP